MKFKHQYIKVKQSEISNLQSNIGEVFAELYEDGTQFKFEKGTFNGIVTYPFFRQCVS